jgi:glycosyltransferase involved in cell wall biosynthesis
MKSIGLAEAFELIVVDDGSSDETRQVLQQLTKARPFLRGIVLRRNSGKSNALMTAFRHARGERIITIDADLQDNPEDIPVLMQRLEEGYDVVSGWRTKRQGTGFRKLGSKLYNWAVRRAGKLSIHDFNCGFKIYRKEVLENVLVFGHLHRYVPLMASLSGFRIGEVPVKNSERKYGQSKYPAIRYQGLFDLVSILFTYRYDFRPLHFFGGLALMIAVPSVIILLYFVFAQMAYLFGLAGDPVYTRPLLILSAVGLLVALHSFLTGFVCDFFLRHTAPQVLDNAIMANVLEEITHETPAGVA